MKIIQFERRLTAEQQEIQDDIIKTLEDTLADARRGLFLGIGIAGVNKNQSTFTITSRTNHFPIMLGAVSRLEYRMHNEVAEVDSSTEGHGQNEENEEKPEEPKTGKGTGVGIGEITGTGNAGDANVCTTGGSNITPEDCNADKS